MNNLTKGEINSLKLEFAKVKSVKNQLKFWDEKLKINYVEFLMRFRKEKYLEHFIIAYEKGDWDIMNKYIILSFPAYADKVQHIKLLNLKALRSDLNERTKIVIDKKRIIGEEIRKIESSFKRPSDIYASNFPSGYVANDFYQADFKFFKDFIKFKQDPDYSKFIPGLSTIQIENGKILGQYYEFLNAEFKKSKTIGSEIESKELTTKQVALLFYSCGILDDWKVDTSIKAKLFSPLLDILYVNLYNAMREAGGKKNSAKSIPQKKQRIEDIKAVLLFMSENGLEKLGSGLQKELDTLSEDL